MSKLTNTAVVIIPNQTIIVGTTSCSWDHPARSAILAALKAKKYEKAVELMSPAKAIVSYGKGALRVSVEDGQVVYKNEAVDGLLNKRLIDMMQQNLPIDYLLRFIDRSRANPSFRAQKELYGFLEYGRLPITPAGTFLARKVVCDTFMDKHSNTVNYKPVRVVEMPRHKVDDNPNNTCSYGLHVYSVEYARYFFSPGDVYLLVEIDPADVVAVPPDYNNTKMRVCKLKSLQQLTREDDPTFFGGLTFNGANHPDPTPWY